ncbi:hypothetical protein J007_02164 [Cryptococcus neoformans]|nr:hypothetical protein J007_02164 [Cryptococcus neoformans var. grubii]OXC62374.1 hypothetical protein C358_02228 [Cryptococcus neoformans var. grubii MW-RSA852]
MQSQETLLPPPVSTPISTEQSPGNPSRKRKRSGKDSIDRRDRCLIACRRCKAKKLRCVKSPDNPEVCANCLKQSEECIVDDVSTRTNSRYVLALEERVAVLESALRQIDPSNREVTDHYDKTGVGSSQPSNGIAAVTQAQNHERGHHGDSMLEWLTITALTKPDKATHPVDLDTVLYGSSPQSPTHQVSSPSLPPANVAECILNNVYRHLQCRYPFLDWARVRHWHLKRESLCFCASSAPLDDQLGAFFIWMVYALGAEFDLQPGLETHDIYFRQASQYLPRIMAPYDLWSVRALLMTTFYAFRSVSGPSLWLLGGFAMRICIEMGLHRKRSTGDLLQDELRKRIFWSAYAFDRLISHASGRPVSIADQDIDVDMPLDIDSSITDPVELHAAVAALQSANAASAGKSPGQRRSTPLTDLTSAIHSIKLYRIRSQVHAAFYAVGAPSPSREATVNFLAQLDDWEKNVPKPGAPQDIPMQAADRLKMRYLHCVLFTLRPAVCKLMDNPSDRRWGLCATAAAEACELDRLVHQSTASRPAAVSICQTFLTGITLLHCLSVTPTVIPHKISSRAIRACCATLAVHAQHCAEARPFQELFEYLVDEIADEPEAVDKPAAKAIRAMFDEDCGPLAALYDQLATSKGLSSLPKRAQLPVQVPPSVQENSSSNSLPNTSTAVPSPFPAGSGLTPFFSNVGERQFPLDFSLVPFAGLAGSLDFGGIDMSLDLGNFFASSKAQL